MFKKGNTASNGRIKGSKGKKTVQWEEFSKFCMEGGLKKFEKELETLTGKDYINAFLQLLEFHKPKLARAIITEEDEKQITRIIFAEHGSISSNGNLHKEPTESSDNSS